VSCLLSFQSSWVVACPGFQSFYFEVHRTSTESEVVAITTVGPLSYQLFDTPDLALVFRRSCSPDWRSHLLLNGCCLHSASCLTSSCCSFDSSIGLDTHRALCKARQIT
jgi:hypothetical protein